MSRIEGMNVSGLDSLAALGGKGKGKPFEFQNAYFLCRNFAGANLILLRLIMKISPTLSTEPSLSKRPDPIIYGKQIIDGLIVRPDSRSVMRKAIEGVPVIVDTNNDYINLYHVFERLVKAEGLETLKLVRQQVGETRWILYVVTEDAPPPRADLERGYDPKRGRYKRYADQLAAGNALTFSDKDEAIKARRAWQLYIPAEERSHLRSVVRAVPKSSKFLVCLLPKKKK